MTPRPTVARKADDPRENPRVRVITIPASEATAQRIAELLSKLLDTPPRR